MVALAVIVQIALFAYAGIAFTEGELAWFASHGRLWPWLAALQRELGTITAPGKELVVRIWPDAADNQAFAANVVGLASLLLGVLLLLTTLRAVA